MSAAVTPIVTRRTRRETDAGSAVHSAYAAGRSFTPVRNASVACRGGVGRRTRDRICCAFALFGRSDAAAIAPKKKNERREGRLDFRCSCVSGSSDDDSTRSSDGTGGGADVELRIQVSSPAGEGVEPQARNTRTPGRGPT